MKKLIVLIAVLYGAWSLFFAADSHAAIYKYLDQDGLVTFADDLQSIPEKFRSSAVIVEGDAAKDDTKIEPVPAVDSTKKPEEHLLPQPVSPSVAPTPVVPVQTSRFRPFSFRLMISLAITISAFVIFGLINNHTRLRQNKKMQTIVRTSLIGIISVYVVVAHVKDVTAIFGVAGKAINQVQQQSAERGKKAGQAIKSLDALLQEAQKAQEASKPAEPEDQN